MTEYTSYQQLEEHLKAIVLNENISNDFNIEIWYKQLDTLQINIVFYQLNSSSEDILILEGELNNEIQFLYGWKFSVEASNKLKGKFRLYNKMRNPLHVEKVIK